MEKGLGATACLICFETTGQHIFVPSDAKEKIISSCNTYLHSTLTKDTLQDVQMNNKNRPPLCKSCFDSGSTLSQLSDQLKTIQKDLSDLSVEFSMAVFHRRSQVYTFSEMENNSQCVNGSSIVEFNDACLRLLPHNLFSTKNAKHNTVHHDIIIDSLPTGSDIINMKHENCDLQFDYMSETNLLLFANDDAQREIDNNEEHIDSPCRQHTTERNRNTPEKQMRIVHVVGGIDLHNCTDSENGMESATSKASKRSAIMPDIRLESVPDIKFAVNDNASVENLSSGEVLLEDEEFSDHSPNISGGKKHKCFHCEKTFDKERQRDNHHATHSGDKPYKCSFCQKKFSRHSKQKRHEKIHAGKKPLNCLICDKAFLTQTTLRNHQKIHAARKGSQGSPCQESFGKLSDRKIKNKIPTEKQPFKDGFSSSSLRKSKLQEESHTGVEKSCKCSYCEKRFRLPSGLKVHERTHTEEKPLKCSFCEKRFAQTYSLRVHERIHTGEKPYKCFYCKKAFSQWSNNNTHEKTHEKQLTRFAIKRKAKKQLSG